jgi:hypothetical protein
MGGPSDAVRCTSSWCDRVLGPDRSVDVERRPKDENLCPGGPEMLGVEVHAVPSQAPGA